MISNCDSIQTIEAVLAHVDGRTALLSELLKDGSGNAEWTGALMELHIVGGMLRAERTRLARMQRSS